MLLLRLSQQGAVGGDGPGAIRSGATTGDPSAERYRDDNRRFFFIDFYKMEF